MKKVMVVSIIILTVLVFLIIKALIPVIDYKFFVPMRDKQRVSDIGEINAAISNYFSYNHMYPKEDEIKFGQSWKTTDLIYLKKVPEDPQSPPYSPYCYNNLGNIYMLCSQMESPSYRCSENMSGSTEFGVCNTCKVMDGQVLNYNYCIYNSY